MKFRNSRQREAVLKLLSKKNYHPTVDELFELMRRDFPKVSLATVYRNVEQLCQMGKIWKIETPHGPSRYDGNVEEHFHIRCEKCGKLEDFWPSVCLEKSFDNEELPAGFVLHGFKVDFFGLCSDCTEEVAV